MAAEPRPDPTALLVPPRLIRRVIKRDRSLTGFALHVPHGDSYVIGRDKLLQFCDRDELKRQPGDELPSTVILLNRDGPPDGRWQRIFHARVHAALAGRLTSEEARDRVRAIGQVEFDEIRSVLRQERLLLPPGDDGTAYEEFAATFLELQYFDPARLPLWFPAVGDYGLVNAVLAQDVDAAALFEATRPAGASDPAFTSEVFDDFDEQEPRVEVATPADDLPPSALRRQAQRAAAAGNNVGAAILRARAAAGRSGSGAANQIRLLAERLAAALHRPSSAAHAWHRALVPLLPAAARGFWPAEARLLFDLQSICVAHERPASSPDLVGWLRSGFRRPLAQPLPFQPAVTAVLRLRRAAARVARVRAEPAARQRLTALLSDALHDAETRLRDALRPAFATSIADVGLRPANYPEQVAAKKLIEELLDRVVERGFLNLGDLRDAVSRNQLKLDDLAGAGELARGDALLRANRELAGRAPGVYRRGEVYLRWLQKVSSLAFSTRAGRWATLNLLVPFGGAFLVIEGPLQVGHEIHEHAVRPVHDYFEGIASQPGHAGMPIAPWWTFVLGGCALWLLLHVPAVRSTVLASLTATGRGLRRLVVDWPAALLRSPWVRWFVASPPVRAALHYAIKPSVPAVASAAVAWALGYDTARWATAGGLAFAGATWWLNSRLGRDASELAADWLGRRWRYVRDFIPGLVRWVADVFRQLMEALDRGLYAVDQWLGFRGGDGRWARAWKMAAGLAWAGVAYVLRFIVVLFVEPQINPIKHFPVVTVSHKLLLPLVPTLAALLETRFGYRAELAGTLAFVVLGKIPGVFGFLVWELTENWRLYRANRPATLRPVPVGSHGETVPRLLRPGFHSGTLPKLFARLRRAERRGRRSARRLRDDLHHVEDAVRKFAERELVELVNGVAPPSDVPIRVQGVEASSVRLRIRLEGPAPCALTFDEQSGWLVASASSPDGGNVQTELFNLALDGFFRLAGVDLTRERLVTRFGLDGKAYDVTDAGLVVWPGGGKPATIYDLRGVAVPPIRWADWIAAWERFSRDEKRKA